MRISRDWFTIKGTLHDIELEENSKVISSGHNRRCVAIEQCDRVETKFTIAPRYIAR